MYLALRELLHDLRHFALITAMITLVSLMVFFLTGLAVGLYGSMTQAVAHWPARTVILSSTSNDAVLASLIPEDVQVQTTGEQSRFGLASVTVELPDTDPGEGGAGQLNAFALALPEESFVAPKVSEGEWWSGAGAAPYWRWSSLQHEAQTTRSLSQPN